MPSAAVTDALAAADLARTSAAQEVTTRAANYAAEPDPVLRLQARGFAQVSVGVHTAVEYALARLKSLS